MPRPGKFKRPIAFSMKDLYLDVSLIACHGNGLHDFTGKRTFNTSFFRENIGFGITDISIEINPSLQPLVDITFKDLYGNTIFGTQRGYDSQIDTSVLFAWPPPKFIFSFKGYLGRKVTWMLNLKTTNVSYVPSDGSYEIKCSFVPNQWGFFADIPFLYLIASKKLRMDKYKTAKGVSTGTEKSKNAFVDDVNSIFSYIRVGKRVEVKTEEITKEFDTLREQINALKYNAANAIYGSNVVQFDAEISGYVNGVSTIGFDSFFVKKHPDLDKDEDIRLLLKRGDVVNKLNTFILLNIQLTQQGAANSTELKGKPIASGTYTLSQVLKASPGTDEFTNITTEKTKVIAMLDKNLAAIDDEIKRKTYKSSKTQLAKLTIGQVLNQIARDTAFILGCILEAGFKGYHDYRDVRDEGEGELIGKSFPLRMGGKDGGEEVPATKENGATRDYGVEKNEWKFVNDFIEAISQGVAEDLSVDEVGPADDLTKRINNAEILRPNPYKPYYSNIAENVLMRSGIIAFLTRSDDPNKPGDYYTSSPFTWDNDSAGSIITLSNDDMSNLSKDILAQLSFVDKRMLRRFCVFWTSFLTDDGELADAEGEEGGINNSLPNFGNNVPDSILDHKVLVDDYTSAGTSELEKTGTLEEYAQAFSNIKNSEVGTPAATLTARELFKELLTGKNNFEDYTDGGEQPGFVNTAYIDVDVNSGNGTYTSYLIKNNGVYYAFPNQDDNTYYFVVFSGDDVPKLKSKNSSNSDGEFDEEDKDEDHPDGMVFISSNIEGDAKDKETPDRITNLNDYIDDKHALDYKKMLNHQTSSAGALAGLSQYLWTKKIQTATEENDFPANNLAFTVYSHQIDTDGTIGASNLVWGPFMGRFPSGNENPSQNQRVSIKAMCAEILKKLDEIETERNLVIGNVASKASEHSASMYKQMHTIFHQWQSIASTDAYNPCGGIQPEESTDGMAERIEMKYGGYDHHIERDLNKSMLNQFIDNNVDTFFLYDYPLAPVNNKTINVKNSIISIEPIYNPNADTTVLNIIQQICTKNNFIFVPFPGDPLSDDINDIFLPYETTTENRIMNYFHVIFAPTPETRTNLGDSQKMTTDYYEDIKNHIQTDAIMVQFGGTDNQIFKSINVGTDATKPTAESILNLQRLVDKENSNKAVTMDCSMLPVLEGRSYKAKVDMLGDSQVYPMQYFFIDKMPLFGGLYQIMKVTHSISPNNMETSLEGIRMRFVPEGGYGGIEPVTLESLQELVATTETNNMLNMKTLNKFDTYSNDKDAQAAVNAGYTVDANGEPTNGSDITSVLQVSPTTSPMEKDKFSPAAIKKVFSKKNYVLDVNNKVTLIGVRKRGSYVSNKFDDFMVMYWNEDGKEQTRIYKITTEPGAILQKKLSKYNQDGIAMMAEGQYVDMYIHGQHNKYDALRQNKPAYFYRQKWPETGGKYTFDQTKKIFAAIGANIHRAAETYESTTIFNWSEGCQVFANPTEFKQFLDICKAFTKKYNQKNFTYTLVNEMDFEDNGATGGPVIDTQTKQLLGGAALGFGHVNVNTQKDEKAGSGKKN